MLGVGWFIINMLREKSGDTIDNVFKLQDLQNPPTAKEPMVFDDDIKIKFGQKTKFRGGFYNVRDVEVKDVVFDMEGCRDSEGYEVSPDSALPTVVSSVSSLKPSEGEAFTILVSHEGDSMMSAGTYVCKFIVRDLNNAANVWETKSVFLTVTA
jgi:hypothetical protein